MKTVFSILAVIFLFIFCFILNAEKPQNTEIKQEETVLETNVEDDIKDKKIAVNEYKKKKQKAHNEAKKYPKMKKISYSSNIKENGISLYLNNPTLYDYPSNTSKAEVCRLLINKINNAQSSIEFAIYGIEGQNEIKNALSGAKERGVLIKGVSDSDENNVPKYRETEVLRNYGNITYDFSKNLMHDKFFIIDNNFLMTGSMNFSNTGCGGYNSNSVIVIENNEIIQAFKNEFNQMFEGKFKKQKVDYTTPLIKINDKTYIQAGFSPVGNLYNKIISKEIKNAKKKIRVSAFNLRYNKMIEDLISAKQRGIEVNVILDAVSAKKNKKQTEPLKEAGIKVKVENWGGKNHEKTISIDDNVLILGSANFTYSGFYLNDENIVMIKNKEITTFYNGFFDLLFNSIDNIYLKIYPRAEGLESGNSCFDKIDNDFNGKIDNGEHACKK